MVSSCLQGQTGPHKDYPGFGGQGSALGGYNLLTGWPDREPVGPFGTITDSLAPRFVASALAAGLLYRRRTGRGVHLDVSQVEAAVYSLSPWILDFDVNGHMGVAPGQPLGAGRAPRRLPLRGRGPLGGRGRLGRRRLGTPGRRPWASTRQPRHASATFEARRAAVDEVEALVAAWTAPRRADEVAEALQGAGIEAVPVADLGDASADPQLHHRDHFVTLEHPCMGACGYERNGFRLSDAPAGFYRPSPTLGEHNDHVLGEILGISSDEQQRLADDGVLE